VSKARNTAGEGGHLPGAGILAHINLSQEKRSGGGATAWHGRQQPMVLVQRWMRRTMLPDTVF
jgi:hypothetical protein